MRKVDSALIGRIPIKPGLKRYCYFVFSGGSFYLIASCFKQAFSLFDHRKTLLAFGCEWCDAPGVRGSTQRVKVAHNHVSVCRMRAIHHIILLITL